MVTEKKNSKDSERTLMEKDEIIINKLNIEQNSNISCDASNEKGGNLCRQQTSKYI